MSGPVWRALAGNASRFWETCQGIAALGRPAAAARRPRSHSLRRVRPSPRSLPGRHSTPVRARLSALLARRARAGALPHPCGGTGDRTPRRFTHRLHGRERRADLRAGPATAHTPHPQSHTADQGPAAGAPTAAPDGLASSDPCPHARAAARRDVRTARAGTLPTQTDRQSQAVVNPAPPTPRQPPPCALQPIDGGGKRSNIDTPAYKPRGGFRDQWLIGAGRSNVGAALRARPRRQFPGRPRREQASFIACTSLVLACAWFRH